MQVIQREQTTALWVFNLEDRYARDRGVRGPHPRPIEPLRFLLIGQIVGGVRTDFDQPRELIMKRNSSGYHLFFGQVRHTDQSVRHIALSAGRYVVRITGEAYQAFDFDQALLPMPDPNAPNSTAPYAIDLEPGYNYPFPDVVPLRLANLQVGCTNAPIGRGPTLLRGALHTPDGRGLVEARVQVVGQSNAYRTDQAGQWVLVFDDQQPSGPVTVHVDLPNGAAIDVANVCVVHGRETSLFETALRGRVMERGRGVRGAAIAIAGQPQRSLTAGDGSWSYYFPLNQAAANVNVTATLPTGTASPPKAVPLQPRSTVVVETFQFP